MDIPGDRTHTVVYRDNNVELLRYNDNQDMELRGLSADNNRDYAEYVKVLLIILTVCLTLLLVILIIFYILIQKE